MATLCSYCGKPLQKEDAHFCNNCGMLIPSHPFSPQSLSQSSQQQYPQSGSVTSVEPDASPAHSRPESLSGIASNPLPETGNASVRPPASRIENTPVPQQEQKTPWPSTRADNKVDPPEWMSRLSKNPLSQAGLSEEHQQDVRSQPPATNAPTSLRMNAPQRELHVKVWEQDADAQIPFEKGNPTAKVLPATPQPIISAWTDVEVSPVSMSGAVSPQASEVAPQQASSPEIQEVENLPTRVLGTVSTEQTVTADASTRTMFEAQDVDELPTRPLTAFPQEKPFTPAETPPYKQQEETEDIEHLATLHLAAQVPPASPSQQKPDYIVVRENTPAPGMPSRSAGPMASQPGFAPVDRMQTPLPMTGPPPSLNSVSGAGVQSSPPPLAADVPPPARRSRKWMPLVIALVILVILVAGTGSWIVIAQPFTVAPITTPFVSFQDQSLGLSVQYPQDWTVKIDRSKSSISFYDSGNTDQLNVQVANTSPSDLAQYLRQQAAQQNVASPKAGSALTFGGSAWQQLQGSVSLSNANYSEVLLVSKHGTHLYTITQLAPQVIYAEEEKVTFSPMRATWRFLA